MQVEIDKDSNELTVILQGRIDGEIKNSLEECLNSQSNSISHIYLDMKEVEAISSNGLRALLAFQTMVGINRDVSVINVNKKILEVFEKTGFTDILTLK